MTKTPKTPLLPDNIKEEIAIELEKEDKQKEDKKTNKFKYKHINKDKDKNNNIKLQTLDYKKELNKKNNDMSMIVKQTTNNTKRKRVIIFTSIISITLLFLLSIFSYLTFKYSNIDTICNNIFIKNVDVSGLTKNEASLALTNYLNENIPSYITLVHNEYEVSLQVASLEPTYDLDSVINDAFLIGKDSNFLNNGISIISTLLFGTNLDLDININYDILSAFLEDISAKLPDTVIQSSYYIEGDNLILRSGSSR